MPSATVENQKQVLSIPLSKIIPNPDNPRGPVDPEAAQRMAESLLEVGQETSIKVRPLTEAERAQYPPCEYMLIGGHVRLEGAKLAGLPTLRAEVLEGILPQDELLKMALDNRWEDMGWWKWDLVIERLLKPSAGLGQRKLATQLGFSKSRVNESWKITRALTPAARDWVDQSVRSTDTENKGFLLTRTTLIVLANLADPQKVEQALRKVLDDQMAVGEVRQMVEGIKAGQEPAQSDKANPTPHPVLLPQGEKEATTPAAKGPSTSAETPGLAQVLGGFLKGGHSGVGKVLGGLAVGGVGAFLLSNAKRAMGTLTRRYMMHGLVGVGALLIGVHFLPKGSHKPVQAPVVSDSPVTASPAAAPNGVITVPPDLEGRVDDASILAQDFTRRFYGYEYLILSNWTSHLQRDLAPEYSDAFFQAFMPPWKMDVITHRQLQAKFHPNQPAKLTALGPNGETFLVRGTASLQSDRTDDDKPVAEGPVALEVHITHSPGDPAEGRVSLVQELTPLAFDFTPAGSARVGPKAKKAGHRSASSKKPTDQGADGAAKFVGDATGELAKKLLGF